MRHSCPSSTRISYSLPSSLDFPKAPLGRPSSFPWAFAAASPSLVRSEIRFPLHLGEQSEQGDHDLSLQILLAYNLGNLWRRLGLPQRIKSWSLTSLQHRLMKTGGRLVKHARYYWLLLAEGHLNRRLFGDMLHRIWALPVPGG